MCGWLCAVVIILMELEVFSHSKFIAFGPRPDLSFMHVSIDTYYKYNILIAMIIIHTFITDLISDSLVPHVLNVVQDTKNRYIPHKAFTYYFITTAWSIYCAFTQLFVIFIAFAQLDLLLFRLASDLLANAVTLSFYLDGKIFDPTMHARKSEQHRMMAKLSCRENNNNNENDEDEDEQEQKPEQPRASSAAAAAASVSTSDQMKKKNNDKKRNENHDNPNIVEIDEEEEDDNEARDDPRENTSGKGKRKCNTSKDSIKKKMSKMMKLSGVKSKQQHMHEDENDEQETLLLEMGRRSVSLSSPSSSSSSFFGDNTTATTTTTSTAAAYGVGR